MCNSYKHHVFIFGCDDADDNFGGAMVKSKEYDNDNFIRGIVYPLTLC